MQKQTRVKYTKKLTFPSFLQFPNAYVVLLGQTNLYKPVQLSQENNMQRQDMELPYESTLPPSLEPIPHGDEHGGLLKAGLMIASQRQCWAWIPVPISSFPLSPACLIYSSTSAGLGCNFQITGLIFLFSCGQ